MNRSVLRSLFLVVVLVFGSQIVCVYGQASIFGTVTDNTGEALIGANVYVGVGDIGTSTDIFGKYELNGLPVDTEVKLKISYTGYEPKTLIISLAAGEKREVNFILNENAAILDEVVVVGYGTQRKRDLVGSIAKLESGELNQQVGSTFETALQGKAPGVQLVQGSGAAGSNSIIRIRGIGSISAGGAPLIVVDGVPIAQENFLTGERGGQNNNPLSSINPADIESIEVLKDASAAAIYGSRGGNGVILITTKRGEKGKMRFNYSSKVGLSRPTNVIDVLDADQWLAIQQEAFENDGGVGQLGVNATMEGEEVSLPNNLTLQDIQGIDTDWIDKTIQTGIKQEHNLSMRTGSEMFNAYVGLSYSNAESYLVDNAFERASGRVNLDFNPSNKFKTSLSTSLVRGLNFRVPQAWAGGLGWAQSTALPIYPVRASEFPEDSEAYDSTGAYYNLYGNPVAQAELTDYRTREWRSINNVQFTYLPTENLNFNLQINYDYAQVGDYQLEDEVWTQTVNIAKSWVSEIHNLSSFMTAQYQVPIINSDHSLSVLGGLEYQNYEVTGMEEEFEGVTGHIYTDPGQTEDFQQTKELSFDVDAFEFASVFGRLNYNYKGRYLLQAVFRRDASSKFGPNRRFGNFPSLGLGYIISEEPWFNNRGTVNYLKFKGSWGITGNSNIPWTEQYATYTFVRPDQTDIGLTYNGQNIRYQNKLANPNLKWEVVRTFDFGFEMGLWDDRVVAGVTYYNRLTDDALLRVALQAGTGLEELNFYENVGKIVNQGVEFNITSRNLVGTLKWTTDFNLAVNRNEVLDVGTATPDALDGGFGDIRVIKGEPVGTNYIVRFSHVDPETGRPIYLDIDGNETFEYNVARDRVPTGNIHPKYIGGITNTFSYGNFDLSFLMVFSIGGKIYDDAAKRQAGVVTEDWNMTPLIFDRWRVPGDEATYPQLTRTMLNWGGNDNPFQNNHTLWLFDASYARLRNLTLGYNVPIGGSSFFRNVRVYFTATNLLTFTDYPGWDPEIARGRANEQERNVGGTNVTYLTPPQEKAFALGFNLDF